MNSLVPIALLLLWLFFSFQGASSFLAFLFLAGGLISLAALLFPQKGRKGKSASNDNAIIVENNSPAIPSDIELKVNPNWSGAPQYKKSSIKMGEAFNVIGKTIMRVIRGKKKK